MSTLFLTISNAVKHWYVPLIFGILFVIFGSYIFTVPLETYAGLSVLFSISFLVSGILEIFFSIQNNKSLQGWGWFLVDGLLSTAIGVYLIANPGVSFAVLPFVVGFTLMFRSFQLLGFSFDMKSLKMLNWGNVKIYEPKMTKRIPKISGTYQCFTALEMVRKSVLITYSF